MLLGELEKQVSAYLWSSPKKDARTVHAQLVKQRKQLMHRKQPKQINTSAD